MLNQILRIFHFILDNLLHIWPYLLITIPLAVAVRVSGASKYISKALKKKPLVAIILATLVGAFSPFCSCGVIPVIASLLIGGVPLAPVMSFWLASPSMDPEIFFLSVSIIGWELAVWRLGATFLMSLSAGFVTHFIVKRGWLGNKILRTDRVAPIKNTFALIKSGMKKIEAFFMLLPAVTATAPASSSPVMLLSENCGCSTPRSCSTLRIGTEKNQKPVSDTVLKIKPVDTSDESITTLSFKHRLLTETVRATLMVTKFMVLAFFLEALITLYIPSEFIMGLLGNNNRLAVITSTLIGIPAYTSNLSALAMVGGLLIQGMTPAAALAYLIAGPTTTIPAMAAVWKLAVRRVFILYISLTLVSAVLSGYLFNFFSLLF